MTPTISVVMPVYNAERYVAVAVESILAQTYQNFEFIIIDDGSTDSSLSILQKYAARDSRIRLISRANGGVVSAYNALIDLAQGEYIARMDNDDISMPNRFAVQHAYLSEHPDCLAVGAWVDLIDSDGDTIGKWEMPIDHNDIDSKNINGHLVMVHPSLMIRRNALKKVNGYRLETQGSEDLDLLLRMAEIGQLANIPEVLLKYRRHSASYTHSRPHEISDASLRTLTDAWQRRGLGALSADLSQARSVPSPWQDHMNWAWYALRIGNTATARKHARRVLKLRPLSPVSWRVAYCAIRGY